MVRRRRISPTLSKTEQGVERQMRHKIAVRKRVLKQYGLTLRDYELMLRGQRYVCAICKQPSRILGRELGIDHNHETGIVRGLLCHNCNRGLGHFKDNPELCFEAARYLYTRGEL